METIAKTIVILLFILVVGTLIYFLYTLSAENNKYTLELRECKKQKDSLSKLKNRDKTIPNDRDTSKKQENKKDSPNIDSSGTEIDTTTIIIPDEKEEILGGKTVVYRKQNFDVYVIDLKKSNLEFQLGKSIANFNVFKKNVETKDKKLIFVTNGGMYHEDKNPVGLYVENEKTISKLNLEKDKGNFYLKPNGVFLVDKNNNAKIVVSEDFTKEKNVKFATQSGPMLLIDGNVHSKLNEGSVNKVIRSGVGIIDSNTVVFAISNTNVNFFDFAMLFKEKYKCKNALFLDGVVSQMYNTDIKRHDKGDKYGVLIYVTKQ